MLQLILDKRRQHKKNEDASTKRRDMMDGLLEIEDECGRKLTDEEIIDVLLMYLNAGHESSGHTIMWATIFLQKNPKIFAKAKVYAQENRN